VATLRTIVIVGASLAGLRAAEALRHEGYDGRLVLVGDEPHLPYDRPPLSKELLAGEWEPEQIALRKQPYDDLEVDMFLGRRATGLDLGGRTVELDGDERLAFDGLVIATGARPRTLPDTLRSTASSCSARWTTASPSDRGCTRVHASSSSAPGSSARRSRRRAADVVST
jgi:NADPH-dependent 2,4-dienoyl-CoA reductase/sulfur reductase-like enzyme